MSSSPSLPPLPPLPRDNIAVPPEVRQSRQRFWLDKDKRPKCECGGCHAEMDLWGATWGRWKVGVGYAHVYSRIERKMKRVQYDVLERGWTCVKCSLTLDKWKKLDEGPTEIPDKEINARISYGGSR